MPTVAELEIDVSVQRAGASAELREMAQQVDALDGKDATVDVDVDAAEGAAELKAISTELGKIDGQHVEPDMDVDVAGILLQLEAVSLKLAEIDGRHVEPDIDTTNASASLNRLSQATVRAASQVNWLATVIFSLGPALIPLAGVAATGIGALATGFAGAAVGAGLFGATAVTNFSSVSDVLKKLQTAQEAYNQAVTDKQRENALKKQHALMMSLEPVERAMAQAVLDASNAWQKFAESVKVETFQIATTALRAFTGLLPSLEPLLHNATAAIGTLLDRMIAGFQTPFWRGFLDDMTRLAGPMMISLGTSFGNIVTGLAGILSAFTPFADSVLGGLVEITAAFAKWGTELGKSEGFRVFMDYIKANTPLAIDTIKNLWFALVAIAQAAAPLGTVILGYINAFLRGIQRLNETNPNLLTLALTIAAIGLPILNLVGPIVAVVNAFKVMSGFISGPLFAALRGLAAVFAIPVSSLLLIGAAIAAVVAGLIYAYTHFESFRNVVNSLATGALALLQSAFQALAAFIGPVIATVVQFVMTEFNKMTAWVQQYASTFQAAWNTIVAIAQVVFGVLVAIISTALNVILGIWNAVWPGLATILQAVWTVISGIISAALEVIRGIITVFAGILAGDWSAVWDGLGMIVQGAWQAILAILQGAWMAIVGVFQVLGGLLLPIWNAIWTTITTVASAIWNAFWAILSVPVQIAWAAIQAVIQAGWAVIQAVFAAGAAVVQAIWTVLWGIFGPIVQTAWAIIVAIIQGAWTVISAIFSAFAAILTAAWNALWNAFGPVVTAAWSAITSAVSTAWNFLSNLVRAGLTALAAAWTVSWNLMTTLVSTAWNAIKTAVTTAFTAVQTFISSTLAAISSAWNTVWNAVLTFLRTTWTTISTTVTTWINNVRSTISSVTASISSGWNSFWNTVRTTAVTFITNIATAIATGIREAAQRFVEFSTDVTSTFTGLISRAFNWGRDLIGGIVDGIRSMIGAVGDAIGAVASAIGDLMPGSPAKEGPLSGQGYVYLRGQRFVDDLTEGLRPTFDLRSASRDIADLLALQFAPGLAQDALLAGRSVLDSRSSGGGVTVNVAPGAVTVQVPQNGDVAAAQAAFGTAGDDLAKAIEIALRRR